jgi:integrase
MENKNVVIARKILDSLPSRAVSQKSQDFYEKTAKLYFKTPEKILETKSKHTFYLRKAALSWYATKQLQIAADELETAQTQAEQDQAMSKMVEAKKVLVMFTPELEKGASLREGKKCPVVETAKRKTKRSSLRGLPANWREQIVEAADADDELKDWLLLMSVAGARPSEIEKGVAVEPLPNQGVRLTIEGAKAEGEYGQPLRIVEVFGDLAAALASAGSRVISAASANQVSVKVGRICRRIFGEKRASLVSSYSFRHQVASDLKASGISVEDASAILGHCVTETKKYYGHANQKRGNLTYKLVEATREVKAGASFFLSKNSGLSF